MQPILSVDRAFNSNAFNPNPTPNQTLVVFDSRVENLESLYNALALGSIAHTIPATADALTTITELLARTGAKSLAIVAHGEPGIIHLGVQQIDLGVLVARAGLLQEWAVDEISLYSCEVGADAGFVAELARVTGARVAAATGKVGAAELGGSWELIEGGQIEQPIWVAADLTGYPGILGDEFLSPVNTFTTGSQFSPAVATLSDGSFVVTWESGGNDGSATGIAARRFNADGSPNGPEFLVNTFTAAEQVRPSVAALSGGGFVVTWESFGKDVSVTGIAARRYNADGSPNGDEFLVNTFTTGSQLNPSVAALNGGGFVVTWESEGNDASGYGIAARRYNAAGIPQGNEFLINTFTTGLQVDPSVTVLSSGGFVVTWESQGKDGDGYGIAYRLFNADGTPNGDEFPLPVNNIFKTGGQSSPSITALSNGGFVVTWESEGNDGSSFGIAARRFNADGSPNGDEFQVNTDNTSAQIGPSVTALSDGGFAVTWTSLGDKDGDRFGVFGQRYNATGTRIGSEFLVNNKLTIGDQQSPSVSPLSGGGFVVSWESFGKEGGTGGFGIAYRVFEGGAAVAAANRAPAGTDKNINLSGNAPYILTAADFGFTDPNDTPPNALSAVKISSLATTGTLRLNGVAVAANAVISVADLNTNQLTFTPTGNSPANFTFQVQDNGGTANGGIDLDATPNTITFLRATGDEFLSPVNTFTTGDQLLPSVATLSDGGFVVTWQSEGNDGSDTGIAARRFNADGSSNGPEFLVNTLTTGQQRTPSVAALSGGGFVVTWESQDKDFSGSGIAGRLYNADGSPNGNEFLVNTFTFQTQSSPSVAALSNGGFIVTWDSSANDGVLSATGVAGRLYNADGTPQGDEFLVNNIFRTANQNDPSVTALSNGGFVVTWESDGKDGNGYGIAYRLFNADGTPNGDEFPLPINNIFQAGGQQSSSVTALSNGGFVVTWQSGNDGSILGIAGRLFNASGTPLGDEFQVNTANTGNQRGPAVTALSDGGFVVTWSSFEKQDGIATGVVGQRYNATGTRIGSEFLVNNKNTVGFQGSPALSPLSGGGFVVAWDSEAKDGDGYGIAYRVFEGAAAAPINVDPINQPPAGTDKNINLLGNSTYILTAADFGFTDPNTPPNALSAVKISSLVTTGTLQLNGVAVAANAVISVADINGGKLTFVSAPNVAGVANFTFQVQDNGGTANGGIDLDATPNTITFNVAPVNHPPVGTDKSISILEDGTYTLTAADFGFADPLDTPANALSAVKISTLATTGTLKLNGVAVVANDVISVADLNGGKLTFAAAPNTSGAANFTFQVQDDGGIANGGVNLDATPNTITFNVAPINDPPAGTDKNISLLEDGTYTLTAADFGFTDPNDIPANTLIAVKLSSLATIGTLNLNGVAVAANAVVSVADINAGKLTFTSAPNASGAANFTFQVQDDGGTANGGVDLDSTPNTITFNVAPVNDPPAGTDKTISLLEDGTYTLTAADFGFTDPLDTPANALNAVKISSLVAAGSLKLNGAAVAIGELVSVVDISAGKLTFTPVANANGNNYANFTFQVQDNGGIANGGIDLDATPNTITFNVAPVNDAPVITVGATDKSTGSVTEIADGALGENARNLNATGTLTITDVDFNDVQTVAVIPKGTPYAGTFTPIITDSTTGDGIGQITWSFSVPDKDIDSLAAGQILTQTYSIIANDGQGGIASQDVIITINGTNDAPVVVYEISDQTICKCESLNFTIPADTFQDVDLADKLTYSATLKNGKPLPDWLKLDALTGEFSGTPTKNFGDYELIVTATDPAGATAKTNLTLVGKHKPQFAGIDLDRNLLTTDNKIAGFGIHAVSHKNGGKVSEIGAFAVDDETGKIGEIEFGSAGYLKAATDSAKIILSALDGSFFNSSKREMGLDPDKNYEFFEVQDGSIQDVQEQIASGETPTNVMFARPDANGNSPFKVTPNSTNDGYEISVNNDELVLNVMKLDSTAPNIPIGAKSQSLAQGRIIDLSDYAGQTLKADITTTSSAAYNNNIAFYAVEDAVLGTIKLANGDIINPGDANYGIEAIKSALTNAVLQAGKNDSKLNQDLTGGKIYAPVLVAQGSLTDFVSKNPTNGGNGNVVNAYFNYLGANPDKLDHFRLLGNNIFGVEDLYGGGDRDFNDVVVNINVKAT